MTISNILELIALRAGQLAFCFLSIWIGYSIYTDFNPDSWMMNYNHQPLQFFYAFLIFAGCSIIFWHLALFDLINARADNPVRNLFFRSFDYIWYLAAIVAASLIINEVQITKLSSEVQRYNARIDTNGMKSNLYSAIDIQKQCDLISDNKEEFLRNYDWLGNKVENICSKSKTAKERPEEFADQCADSGFVDYSDIGIFSGSSEVAKALSKLDYYCTIEYRKIELPKKKREIEDAIESSHYIPEQRSSAWLLILVSIVGLRLTRTTSEVVDGVRAWNNKRKASSNRL